MSKKTYTPAFKAKVVLEVLQGESELSAIASKYDLNPNMVRTWKKEFLDKAPSLFEDSGKAEKESSQEGGRPGEEEQSDAQNNRSADH